MDRSIQDEVRDEFLPLVKNVFGDRLTSVVLYGSGADGSYRPGVSDVNILILLDEPQPELLERLAKEGRRRMRKRRITPMVISEEEYRRGADVFPMEYLDIRDRHVTLYGSDLTGELQFSDAHLRQQLEQQLRGSLFSLRQLILSARGRKRVLSKELPRWYGSLQALFKGLLRLVEPGNKPRSGEAALPILAKHFSFDTAPFEELLALREGKKPEVRGLSHRLVLELATLVRGVDRWEAP
ncbi:MAG: nucleotidyltransferase domain-containing protein [Spirochaetaceae bacterium]